MSGDEKDQRYYPRYYNVKDAFPGSVTGEDGSVVPGRIMDVSRDGVGFLSDERIVPGAKLTVNLGDRKMVFRVVYCTADIIYTDKYRCGLNLDGAKENLVSIFDSHGALEEVKF